jgi:hypothetical protein
MGFRRRGKRLPSALEEASIGVGIGLPKERKKFPCGRGTRKREE